MLENENYKIVQMHICSFERKDGMLAFDMSKYPQRLCIHDKKNKMIVDVETQHQYPYVRILNMQYFYDIEEIKLLTPDKRVGCMEYATIIPIFDSSTIEKCKNIIDLLKKGVAFPDGNQVLSNEQYLEAIKQPKEVGKTKKIGRKRK